VKINSISHGDVVLMITNLYIDLNGTSLHDIEKLGLNYLILARTNENNS